MATFVPDLLDGSDPASIEAWAARVADVVNGQISIGEPVSHDTALLPNGVKGHILGSFVEVTMESDPDMLVCTHNLNIEPKGWAGANPVWNDPLNVGWITVSQQHVGGGGGGGAGQTMYMGGAGTMTANAIELMFHFGDHLVNAGANRALVRLFFFPVSR